MPVIHAPDSPGISEREIGHMRLAMETARECVVLLENKDVLPLAPGSGIALFGNGARHTVRGGTGSGDVNVRQSVSVEKGLMDTGFAIKTGSWLDRQEERRAEDMRLYKEEIRRMADDTGISSMVLGFSNPFRESAPVCIEEEDLVPADAAVYVIARTSGEGADRRCVPGDYMLYPEEERQLRMIGRVYRKVAVLLNTGGVMDLSALLDIPGIGAVLLMGQLGNAGGAAIADILAGLANPSGKLTDTWAKKYADYPASASFGINDGNTDDEYYTEGIYVGYRYFDSFRIRPLYPFGYGLSYTTFSLKCREAGLDGETVSVEVDVKNTGGIHDGKEVVQVYVSQPQTKLAKPYQQLVGFQKTGIIPPGETTRVTITFSVRDMASYSEEEAAWILEAGDYVLRVGNDSAHTKAVCVLTLDRSVKTEILRNLFPDSGPLNEIKPPKIRNAADAKDAHAANTAYAGEDLPASGIKKIVICADAIVSHVASYQDERIRMSTESDKSITILDVKTGKRRLEDMIAQLTLEELAELCVGTLRLGGSGSIAGNASYIVPGAAGDTSSIISESRGIRNMILADGPAGLRLQPVFKTTKDGKLLSGGETLGDIEEPFDPSYTEDNTTTYYQYCTAIPIGWSLAQSWNMELLERTGCMVGREMELFGVDLWLAPALNIHRDPLCGRNFEYFSEDPLISGKAAAAITNGVQKHAGKGTTIKHFAANNQEENRYFTNSHISERAIREIYLRGFEIAIREASPVSVMTSYNLLNGTHTANHYDLLQSVLRDEWGYTGVVMTDWYTTQHQPGLTGEERKKYPISASTGCIFAGNDLQMPGCKKNVDDLIEAVRTGRETDGYSITMADLQQAAMHIVRAVMIASDSESAAKCRE